MRTMIPVGQLSTDQLDRLREDIEFDLMTKAKKARPQTGNWICRQLLPWTDLALVGGPAAGVLTDFWGTQVLVASTALIYVNHQLQDDEFVGIYGLNIRDVNPSIIKVLFQTGAAASTYGAINVEQMYGQLIPEIVTPEYYYYPGGSTVYVQVIPDAVGKAVGADGVADHLILLGMMVKPAGEVLSL